MTGVVAGLGLTVALFVCGQAFTTPALQGASKMGAVFSVGAAFLAAMLHGVLNSAAEPEKQRPELAVAGG